VRCSAVEARKDGVKIKGEEKFGDAAQVFEKARKPLAGEGEGRADADAAEEVVENPQPPPHVVKEGMRCAVCAAPRLVEGKDEGLEAPIDERSCGVRGGGGEGGGGLR
jgi:hypothetical protein